MQGGRSTPGSAQDPSQCEFLEWKSTLPPVPLAQQNPDGMSLSDRVAHLARTLEREVIPRLAASHRGPARGDASNDAHVPLVGPAGIEAFTAQVTEGDEAKLLATVAELRAQGTPIARIFLELLAPTARHFGDLWSDDRCDFTTVTVGLGRLQRLMRELSPSFGTEVAHPPSGRRALLVRAPGEQHSFGQSMVAEFFRRAGWEVAAGGADAEVDPVAAVRGEWFDVAGFSVGSEARMGWLPGCIAAVRLASCNRNLRVLVGGPLLAACPGLVAQMGADGGSADGSAAPGLAESLLAGRVIRS